MDPLRLLDRLRSQPSDSLVDSLRRLHDAESKTSGLPTSESAVEQLVTGLRQWTEPVSAVGGPPEETKAPFEPDEPAFDPAPDDPTPDDPAPGLAELLSSFAAGDVGPAAELLRRVHSARTESRVAGSEEGTQPAGRGPQRARTKNQSYDSLREHFAQHEQSLRQQERLTDRILDQLQHDPSVQSVDTSPLQQELRLVTTPGAPAAGRFAVTNELEAGRRLHFRCGRLRGGSNQGSLPPRARFEPESPWLEAGETRAVRVSLELDELSLSAGDRLETVVDVLASHSGDSGEQSHSPRPATKIEGAAEVIAKLWVTVEVRDLDPGPGGEG